MTPAVIWAAVRAFYSFTKCDGQRHKTVCTDHSNLAYKEREKLKWNQTEVLLLTRRTFFLPLGQTSSRLWYLLLCPFLNTHHVSRALLTHIFFLVPSKILYTRIRTVSKKVKTDFPWIELALPPIPSLLTTTGTSHKTEKCNNYTMRYSARKSLFHSKQRLQ